MILVLGFPVLAWTQANNNGYGGMTGNDLLPKCQAVLIQAGGKMDAKTVSVPTLIDENTCLSYIQGFIDGFHVRDTVCFPADGATGGQMARVVTKWLLDHPARLHEPAWGLIFLAFQESYLCPLPKSPQSHKP
jgi:hypothetical protein